MNPKYILTFRIIYSIILFLLVWFLPVWISGILIIIGFVVFKKYLEGVCIAMLYEIVFTPVAFHFHLRGTLLLFCILILVEIIRPYIRD